MAGSIEVLVYSGRVNPRVELDSATEVELEQRLSKLEPLGRAFVPGDGLGYRGLHIALSSGSALRGVDVGDGSVQILKRDGSSRHVKDPDRSLERWLLGVIVRRLPEADRPTVEGILGQLDSSSSGRGKPPRQK